MMALGPPLFLLACVYRRVWIPKCRIIVVVGSYGKTTTTRVVANALNCSTPKGNSQPDLALGILRLGRRTPRAVFEAGISRKRQMWPLAVMLRPDVVVVTSIGSEHQESLGSLAVTRTEKARMVEALPPGGLAVLNGDDSNVLWMASRTSARVIRCGRGPENAIRGAEVSFHYPPRMDLRIVSGEAEWLVSTRLVGHSMVLPVLAGLAVAREEQVPETEILGRIERTEAVERRMEPVPLVHGAWAIVDDRKALPETIAVALRSLADLPARRRWVVMGDIGGIPRDAVAESSYRSCGADLGHACDRLVLVTADARKRGLLTDAATQAGLPAESITAVEGNLSEVVELLRRELRPGDAVLMKGRFHERLVRVALALEGQDVRCWVPRCEPRDLSCRTCPALLAAEPR